MTYFNNKKILITGACGTIGSELIRQLLHDKYQIKELIGIDNNETSLFFLEQKYLSDQRAKFFVSDIRDKEEMLEKSQGIDIIFHAAALKHVALCEKSPAQAVKTNIYGLQNVISAANFNKVEKVIFTSSDKAVNPTNVMGTTKLMGERLMTAANTNKKTSSTIFASTRFGNVLGSSGSVIPIFHNQIINNVPVTITDKSMTRFVMSVKEAVKLVLNSAVSAKGGEVFVTKMPVMRIQDLAEAMIDILAPKYNLDSKSIPISNIGIKPGEKLYEELMSNEELGRTVELSNFFSVLPAYRGIYEEIEYNYKNVVNLNPSNVYISENQTPLTKEEIKDFLQKNDLLKTPNESSTERYWPGDKK